MVCDAQATSLTSRSEGMFLMIMLTKLALAEQRKDVRFLIGLIGLCLKPTANERPSTEELVEMLKNGKLQLDTF